MKLYTMVIESFGVLVTGNFFKNQVQIIKPVVIRSLGHLVFWVIMFYIFCFCARWYVWSLSHLVFWSLINIQAKKYKFEKNKPVVIRSLGHLVFWVIMFYIFLFLCQAICMVIESFGFLVTGKYSSEKIQVWKKLARSH